MKTVYSILTIILIIGFFFLRLFIPDQQIFVTPDFGQSDIFQLNLPAKYSLSQSLKNNELPLWNKNIGNGFPQFAEGQIGTFNILNLVVFKFLPFPLSYNIAYVLIFMTISMGTYFYCKTIGFSNIISVYCSIIFTFSGFFIGHIPHFNLIQTTSFLPWIFLTNNLYVKTNKIKYLLIISLLISQQLFSGFPQVTLITIIGLLFYDLYFIIIKKFSYSQLIFMGISISFAFLLSAVQLLPSKELLDMSSRKNGLSLTESSYFSFPLKNLVTFFNPSALGNPRNGNYPYFSDNNGSIFWENIGYIGILPLLFFLLSLILLNNKKEITDRRILYFYMLLLCLAFLMMLGKFSPLYFFYSFPPLSYFRVPSRFILLFIWALVILSGLGLKQFENWIIKHTNKKTGFIIILLVTITATLNLFAFSYYYNPLGKVSEWLKKPEYLNKRQLQKNHYFTIGGAKIWNDYFLKNGWSKNSYNYLNLNKYLIPNLNVFYDLPAFQVYPIMTTIRYFLTDRLIRQGIQEKDNKITINNASLKLFKMNNIGSLISALPVDNLKKNYYQYDKKSETSIYVYSLDNPQPRIYFAPNYETVSTVIQFSRRISSENYSPQNTVLLEENQPLSNKRLLTINGCNMNNKNCRSKINILKDNDQKVSVKVSNNYAGFLVITDTYYPGWEVYINGKKDFLYAANLNQKAVFLNKGDNIVDFIYQPHYFQKGLIISSISYFIALALTGFLFFPSFFHKFS